MAAAFTPTPGCDNYCVVGNPIAHSRSPWIHAAFARQTGQSIAYAAVLVARGELAATLEALRRAGVLGVNVTLPYKEQAYALAVRATPRARQAGAANTLWPEPEAGWGADNTDGVGLVRDLIDNHGVELEGRRILLLGAGGSARGVLGPLLEQGPAAVHVVNRDVARARDLAALHAPPAPVTAGGYDALPGRPYDLLVNATAASLAGELPPLGPAVLGPATVCYDLMYAARPTVFMTWALAQGAARALDGLGMLVEQAAEAFERWRGIRPLTGPVIAALRGMLDSA